MAAPSSLTKNTSYLTMAYIIQKVLTLGYFIVVARVYGPVGQGQYSASLAFVALFAVLVDLGISSVLTREVARRPERADQLLSQALLFRMVAGVVMYVATLFVLWGAGDPSHMVLLVLLAGVATWFDMLSTPCWAVFRGLQRLRYEAISVLIITAIMVGMGVTVALLHGPLYLLVVAIVLASTFNFFFALVLLAEKAQIHVRFVYDHAIMRQILIWTAPFAVGVIASRIYTNIDVNMLQRMVGDAHAGWYSAANKIVLALQFIPAAMAAAVYAPMSAQFENDKHQMGRTFAMATYYLMLLVIPIGVGLAVLAPYFISIIGGGAYERSVPVLRVLSIALVSAFLIFPIGSLQAASNRQKQNGIIMCFAAILNVGLNLFLIPRLQEVGAAWTSAFTYTFILIVSIIFTWGLWKDRAKFLAISLIKMIIASAGMAGAIFGIEKIYGHTITEFVLSHVINKPEVAAIIHALGSIVLGAVVYGVVLLLLRGITWGQMRDVVYSILQKDESPYEKNTSRNA